MKTLHLACLNNDPEIQPNMGSKCNPIGGEPHMFNIWDIFMNLEAKYNFKIKFLTKMCPQCQNKD